MEYELYDLREDKYPRGEFFYSLQVFKCPDCGVLWNMTGWAEGRGGGAVADCPHRDQPWHKRIAGLQKRLREVHPTLYLEAVKADIDEILREEQPANVLEGEPNVDCIAKACGHEGYAIGGVAFAPGGRKRLSWSGFRDPVFPPFVEEVFEQIAKSLDEPIRSLLREEICLSHESLTIQERTERGEPGAEEADQAHMKQLQNLQTRIEALPPTTQNPGHGVNPIQSLTFIYHDAYRQWRAEQHLAEHGQQQNAASV